jgi:hypothetical protein
VCVLHFCATHFAELYRNGTAYRTRRHQFTLCAAGLHMHVFYADGNNGSLWNYSVKAMQPKMHRMFCVPCVVDNSE